MAKGTVERGVVVRVQDGKAVVHAVERGDYVTAALDVMAKAGELAAGDAVYFAEFADYAGVVIGKVTA